MDVRSAVMLNALWQVTSMTFSAHASATGGDPGSALWLKLIDHGVALVVVAYISWRLTSVTIPRLIEEHKTELAKAEERHQREIERIESYHAREIERLRSAA